ncbi:MAG: hypothetical protein E7056_03870 [Lentisphaerae bacterium]|nr:hypothetical protein [Lentisphaerota bacterium]
MNELYKTCDTPRRSKRRWVYLICAAVVGASILLLPQGRTALWDIAVTPNSQNVWSMTIPEDCRLEKIYLRCSNALPQEGKLCDLKINDHTVEISNIGTLPVVDVTPIEGYVFKALPLEFDLAALAGQGTLNISFESVRGDMPENGLFVGIELFGAEESVKNWRKFIVLRSKDMQTLPMLEVK